MQDVGLGFGADLIGQMLATLGTGPSIAIAAATIAGVCFALGWILARARSAPREPGRSPQFAGGSLTGLRRDVDELDQWDDSDDGEDDGRKARRRHEREVRAQRALAFIEKIETARASRVIAIIHRETLESDHLSDNDLEDVLTAIAETPPDKPLDIVLHTFGGSGLASTQIARAIKAHKGKKTAIVPYFAMSAGTFIALACDEILMSPHACLGPIDPQLGLPAISILNTLKQKRPSAVGDVFLTVGDIAQKALKESREEACELMQGTYSHDGSCAITDDLSSGRWTHGRPITAAAAQGMGLRVKLGVPKFVTELVRVHRVPHKNGPSVWYR